MGWPAGDHRRLAVKTCSNRKCCLYSNVPNLWAALHMYALPKIWLYCSERGRKDLLSSHLWNVLSFCFLFQGFFCELFFSPLDRYMEYSTVQARLKIYWVLSIKKLTLRLLLNKTLANTQTLYCPTLTVWKAHVLLFCLYLQAANGLGFMSWEQNEKAQAGVHLVQRDTYGKAWDPDSIFAN